MAILKYLRNGILQNKIENIDLTAFKCNRILEFLPFECRKYILT